MIIKQVQLPPESEKLAELVGIMLGDGNLQELRSKGQTFYQLRIACHVRDDLDYYQNYIIPLLNDLFLIKASVYYEKHKAAVQVYTSKKVIIKFLIKKGLKPGNKIANGVTIPSWILKNDRFLKACVRGLIDTDGSIYLAGKWVQICFKNLNTVLLTDLRAALIKLGFYTSKITWNKIYISRKYDIQKYYKEIGFSNLKHRRRYLKFYSPVV